MSEHGNSLNNENHHHLYQIRDEERKDIYKYGISDDPIEEDGLSKRLRYQLNLMNRIVGWIRFVVKVLIENIPGRRKAREIEDRYIDRYRKKHGRSPRGNPRGGTK